MDMSCGDLLDLYGGVDTGFGETRAYTHRFGWLCGGLDVGSGYRVCQHTVDHNLLKTLLQLEITV